MFVHGVVFCILFAHVHLGRMCWSVCVEACVLDIVTLFGMVGIETIFVFVWFGWYLMVQYFGSTQGRRSFQNKKPVVQFVSIRQIIAGPHAATVF